MNEFLDTVGVSDEAGPKGFVIIKNNKTNEILVKKYNMILKNGKDAILSKFLAGCDWIAKTILDDYSSFNLVGCAFSKNDKENTYANIDSGELLSGDLLSIADNDECPYIYKFDNRNFVLEGLDDGHFALKISKEVNLIGNDTITFNSLILLLGEENYADYGDLFTKSQVLNMIPFSRIVFDPITLTQESSLNLTYYVYF